VDVSQDEVERGARTVAFGLARLYIGALLLEQLQAFPSPKAEAAAAFWV